jgi:serine/threonine protein kinase/tetratricopeptide (TPR) repeat protein
MRLAASLTADSVSLFTGKRVMIGTTISHYQIIERIGGGGMGVVYKAHDTRLDRDVALKFLPPHLTNDPEAKRRLIHEAQAASALQHTNICVVHDIDESADGQMYLVMEFIEGETLDVKIKRGPLKIPDALNIAIQVTQGLTKAHEHGIVHRDIKPANIIVTNDGVAKILDFGLARLSGQTMMTKAGTSLGTLAYMSPEQTRGEKADQRSDIWALGAVLYELVTGKMPFSGEYENVIVYEIANVDPPPATTLRTGVPMDLERVITKAMAKSADDRYQHADEMLVDLRRVAKESKISPVETTVHPVAAVPRKRGLRKLVLPASMLMLLLIAFFALKPLLFDDILVSEPKPVAVVAFLNQTGDASYDYLREAIPNLLITSLEQSKYLRVMTWERMNDVLRQMGKADVRLIDKDLGFELCRREGIHAIVIGTFIKAGETFATDVKVLDVDTKDLLKTASARGDGVQSILNTQIDQLSKEIARGVGLSRRKVEATPSQIAEVTTSSMDAYNLFLRGRAEYEKIYYAEAVRYFSKAVELDSNFALAHLYLSRAYGALIEPEKSIQAITKAMTLAARAPEKERLMIDARYTEIVEKDSRKGLALNEELVREYPQEKRFHDQLGQHYQALGRIVEAEREFEKAIELDPNFASPVNGLAYLYKDQGLYQKAIETLQRYAALSPGDANPYDSMGEILLCMGDLDGSLAKYQEALRIEPSFYGAYKSMGYVRALKEDYAGALECIDTLIEKAPSVGLKTEAMAWRAMLLTLQGRNQESSRELDRMSKAVDQRKWQAVFSPLYWMRTWEGVQRGQFAAAREQFARYSEVFSRGSPQRVWYSQAISDFFFTSVYLKEGRTDSARTRINNLLSALERAEMLKSSLVMIAGILQAEVLLAEGKPDSAIATYRATPVIGPAMAIGWRLPLYNMPPFRDVVSRAFVSKGEPDSAITEYRRLMTIDRASKDRRWINPLYHYRLAVLCQKAGRQDQARAEFERFLELWKNADRDAPELLDARKQFAMLAKGAG